MVEKLGGEPPATGVRLPEMDPQGGTARTKGTKTANADQFGRTTEQLPELGATSEGARIDPADRGHASVRAARLGARRWNKGSAIFVSSQTINDAIKDGGIDPALAMVARGVYSKDGPLGPSGMFSDLGAIRENPLHPSWWIKEWTKMVEPFARAAASNPYSPVSKVGPLGDLGPTNRSLFEALLRPSLGPYVKELEAGGVLGGVGNQSAFGALGIAGPGGQLGGSGDVEDKDGNFRDAKGRIERTISVGARKIELTELYPEEVAERMKNNDTSWAVLHDLKKVGDSSGSIPFTSHSDQWVQIAVAHRPGDVFEISLEDKKGRVIQTVDSSPTVTGEKEMENMMQFQVPKGMELRVQVRLKSSEPIPTALMKDPLGVFVRSALAPWAIMEEFAHPDEHPYFLICSGSGTLEGSDRVGAHQKRIDWTKYE